MDKLEWRVDFTHFDKKGETTLFVLRNEEEGHDLFTRSEAHQYMDRFRQSDSFCAVVLNTHGDEAMISVHSSQRQDWNIHAVKVNS